MLERIRSLAQFVKDKKPNGDKFVLMLGAGASLSSGIKPTRAIMEELVGKYRRSQSGTLEDQFDQLWAQSSNSDRRMMLNGYLDRTPSEGFRQLAELIQREYFDLVISFNFDRLLERALDEAGVRYKSIIRGETSTEAIASLIKAPNPRVKLLKMHGSLESADYFLFSKEEMLNYPHDLEALIGELTARDIIICGYAFSDMCVMRAFNASKDSGSIYFVNPSGAVDNIKGFLIARRSQEKVINGETGKFDQFVDALYHELSAPPGIPLVPNARQNLFKFLDSYQEDQRSWFLGRRSLTRRVVKQLETAPPAVLYLYGKPKVGKTSFVRAGLIPYLDRNQYEAVYIRCKKDVEPQLRAELERRFSTSFAGLEWDALLRRVTELSSKRVVLFMDQFERPCRTADESPEKNKVLDFVNALVTHAGRRLMVVFIPGDEIAFWKLMAQASPHARGLQQIVAMSRSRVSRILRYAATKGGVVLDPKMVSSLCDEYQLGLDRPTDRNPFTLMHVQTICYYLVKGFQPTWQGPDGLPQSLVAALESIKEDASLIDLLDDLPSDERRVIRSFLKVICDPNGNTRKIIEFIKNHFPEIKEDRFPEPIV